ncbi:MAG TPA: EAL domain-containing protein, partial [Bacillota bacterium]|nr:EAL domain-containing protein [Bacillota bacterium]
DLDNFHWIIDYLGYQIGDLVLKRMANRLIELCPENGFLAKEKDDTFIVLLANFQSKESVHEMADEIIQAIAKSVKIEQYEFHVTASMGISFYPDNGDRKLILLENAHAALYHAKNLGKNNYQVYSFDRDISSHKKYALEKDLRQAIENEEFEIYYQPLVNSQTNAIIGAEALIRWHHKDWGIVSPSEFIPIAEEKHLIHDIGDWVIHSVCQQLHIWREQANDICPISINISPIRFLKPGIVDTVKEALTYYKIPAKYIQLEVTEGSLLQNNEHVLETLRALKDLGVKIALDDFGTGYSTFQYLQTFDIDVLKIDKSFIQNIFYEEKNETKEAAIVSSFIHLAQGLNMTVVAEGVEEYEQLEFLSQKQCDMIQGYIYSKPVPVDEFERLVQRRYLRPQKRRRIIKPEEERRKYYRFAFPFHLPAKMHITEVNQRKVNIGYATILVENLSLGGIRFLSTFRLPVVSNMKLKFEFELMEEHFNLPGFLVYRNEERTDIFSYGVTFHMTEGERDKLAEIVNRMAILRKLNQEIPNTHFIEEDPHFYLRKHLM